MATVQKYTITSGSGGIVGYAADARAARKIMAQYACPMYRYLSVEIPTEAHVRGAISGVLRALLAHS